MRSSCRVGILGFLLLGIVVQSSPAQSERRYVLGESVSFDVEKTPSLEKRDFVADLESRSRFSERLGTIPSKGSLPASARLSVLPRADSTSANIFAPIGLGVVGGAVGLFSGGLVGAGFARASGCESFCALGYTFLGAIVGETVGVSSGVYLGTTRRGSYLLTLLGGALSTAGMIGLASQMDGPALLIAGPAVQLAVTIPIARSAR